MDIKVTIKNIYGVDKVFPADEKARLLAELAGTKTLTTSAIELIKKLGFKVLVVEREMKKEL